MRFSFKKRKITPDFSFVQQGFAARTKPRKGIHDDIYASVAVIRANETIVLISLDVISSDREFGDTVREEIAKRYKIGVDNTLISHTHTHGSLRLNLKKPAQTREETDKNKLSSDIATAAMLHAYALGVSEIIYSLVGECLADLTEGDMYFTKEYSKFGISRRKPTINGKLEFKPCDDAKRNDYDLFLLTFVDENGKKRGIIYSYACHPTSCGSDNLLITSDYPGAVRRHLKERYDDIAVLFMQGCGADVKPRMATKGSGFYSMTPAEMTDSARSFADEISKAADGGGMRKITPNIKIAAKDIKLPCENWTREKWESIIKDEKEPMYRRDSAKAALKKLDEGQLTDGLKFRIHCIAFDNNIRIVAMENEVVNEYGRLIKNRVSGDTITLGYTNSTCCYIPTKRVLREGGYECDSFLRAGTTGPFIGETEDVIVDTAERLVESIKI